MLAISTLDRPNLLILDEPTNHLDIDAREELLRALNDFAGAVVLVSHDRRLVEATVERLLLVAEGTARIYDGDLDAYRAELFSPESQTRAGGAANRNRNHRRERAERRLGVKPLKDTATAAEKEIAKLSREIAEIDAAMVRGGLFTNDPAGAAGMAKRRTAAARALSDAEHRWLEASQAYEDALNEN
jgi:ATP-binding cassette subfamily F protein 3